MGLAVWGLLGVGGLAAVVLATRSSAAAPAASKPSAPGVPAPSAQSPGLGLPKAEVALDAATLERLARVVAGLQNPTGEALQAATALEYELRQRGFTVAADQLNAAIRAAANAVATPPLVVPASAELPRELAEKATRAIQFNRNPAELRAIAAEIRKHPSFARDDVKRMVTMLEGIAASVEQQTAENVAVSQVDVIVNQSAGQPTAQAPVGVIPSLSIPALSPAPVQVPVPQIPIPQPVAALVTPVQKAAADMVAHLRSLQKSSGGVSKAKGREDKSLVEYFQQLAGDARPDGLAGPGTMKKAALHGQYLLPLVMYWPKGSTQATVSSYRSQLIKAADELQATGKIQESVELRQSAAAEKGQGGVA
jgi:hypothetical protein